MRSDIERKRRYGLGESEASGAGVGTGIYDSSAKANIYKTLAAAAETSLRVGQNVIADASFLKHEDRQSFRDLAKRIDVDFIIVDAHAVPDELLRRVRSRKRRASDASEADNNVLQYQYDHSDSLDAEELQSTVAVATDADVDLGAIVEKIGGAMRQ